MKPLMDEDYAYEQYRQRKLDEELIIGSDLKTCDKIQRYAHHDPAPALPFEEDKEHLPRWTTAVALVCIALGTGLAAYAFFAGV